MPVGGGRRRRRGRAPSFANQRLRRDLGQPSRSMSNISIRQPMAMSVGPVGVSVAEASLLAIDGGNPAGSGRRCPLMSAS